MALNPSIILSGSTPNLVQALDAGTQAAARTKDFQHQQGYRNALATHGAGAMNGDQEAMNALAGFDPAAVQGLQQGQLGMDQTRLGMDATRQRMRILDQEQVMAVQQQAAAMTAAERQAEAESTRRAVAGGVRTQSPQQWDALMTEMGQPELVGRFEDKDVIAASFLDIADAIEMANGGGGLELPASVVALQWQAEQAGLQPGTPEYQSFILNGGGDPATFRALDMQAKAAGFQEGTPEYAEFMATRGAGLRSYASTEGANRADIETGGAARFAVESGGLAAQTAMAEDAAAARARGAAVGSAQGADAVALVEMERNMPGLMATVERLDQLSGKANFGLAQVAADDARRAAGLEVSEAGIARAEYIAIVDNEVLPLLRQTFGAAFTVEEGARLRATLGNENGTPAEKRATLQAFIAQKAAQLEAMGRGGAGPAATQPAQPAQPIPASDLSQMSDDELQAIINGGGQ